jgi:hypothetical protein
MSFPVMVDGSTVLCGRIGRASSVGVTVAEEAD